MRTAQGENKCALAAGAVPVAANQQVEYFGVAFDAGGRLFRAENAERAELRLAVLVLAASVYEGDRKARRLG